MTLIGKLATLCNRFNELLMFKKRSTLQELDDLIKGKVNYDIFKALILQRSENIKDNQAAETLFRIVINDINLL